MRMLRETLRLVLYALAAIRLRVRVRPLLWRLLAQRAATRLVRRAIDWLAPAG